MNLRRTAIALILAISLSGVGTIAYAHGKPPTAPQVYPCTHTIYKTVNSRYTEQSINGYVVDETVSLLGLYDSMNTSYYCGSITGEYSIYCDSSNDCGGLSVYIMVNGYAGTNVQGPTQINSFTTSTFTSGSVAIGDPGGNSALAHNNIGTIQS